MSVDPPASELLTVREVAAEIKVVDQTVRNWIDRGELTGVRVGSRRVRVRRSDLDRFLEAQAVQPTISQSRADLIRNLEARVADLAARVEALEATDRTRGSL